tara:strand:+ start:57 stop:275 length:219 start_codon:yes stop_codon:yes gene_type:complete
MVIKKRSCLESGTDDGFDSDYDATQEPNKRHKTAIEQEIEEAEEYERRKETEQRSARPCLRLHALSKSDTTT